MSQFNITGSNVGQLNDKGNNYQFSGNSGNVAVSEEGNAVVTQGSENKVQVDRPKSSFISLLWAKVKLLWAWAFG